ncbi:MAG TPA: BamA/TamA family outer membrane protein [Vicinamibacterales bacterium]|nr:BamA/TamA family outer membrane protein [Vicinamibacterales bacterium]
MSFRSHLASALSLALVTLVPTVSAHAQQSQAEKAPSNELDQFMERVLARRDVNKKVLNDYILDERETFHILGPGRYPLHRTNREYTWFVRDGMHVRSPLKFDGVPVPESGRVEYEDRWIRREKARQERKAKGEKESKEVTIGSEGISTNVVPTEPRFVSEAYFMDFKFEAGNYYLAGREQLEGQPVLRIEYYPTNMFKDDDTPDERRKDRGQKEEDEISRKMNKTALVTLWVDPTNHQIVKYTFDNVWLDFLPAAWLVRIDSMRASMTMFQPFEGVWLPKGMDISAAVTLANGSFEAGYNRGFSQYRQADVKSKIRIPKTVTLNLTPTVDSKGLAETGPANADQMEEDGASPHPSVTGSAEPLSFVEVSDKLSVTVFQEVVREIRIHGNAAVPDAEVLKLAGIAVGAAVDDTTLDTIKRRLQDSGHFSTIDIRKRYRSLTDTTDVALVLVVHEKTAVVATAAGEIKRPMMKRITSRVMFLPILSYADGYGFTYGARFSTVNLLGAGERLSVPMSWGGTRRIALEAERSFKRGPLTRILGSATLKQHDNPGFVLEPEEDDDATTDRRTELKARAERSFGRFLFTGVETTRAEVDFGPLDTQQQWTVGADAALDTRGNPNFPSNAIYAGGSWNALHLDGVDATNRYSLDGRGYLRLIKQGVLAGRALYLNADGPLPLHERYLIGGSDTLRGFRTGELNGTRFLVTSAELRVPITSVITGAKLGLTVFYDAVNKLRADGEPNDDLGWRRGAGAGLFLIASVVKLNLDVAHGIDREGGTRVHFSSGFSF